MIKNHQYLVFSFDISYNQDPFSYGKDHIKKTLPVACKKGSISASLFRY